DWSSDVCSSDLPPENKHIFPASVPIATQLPHAVGAAWAEKRKGTKNSAIVYFGDGATSEGDFHEGMNFASVFQTPTIFFNQNNGYAISVPIEKQMHSETIAQKALAYGMPSVRVDGNDCFSVYFETKKALDVARSGGGPTLIEAVTWRKGAHTTADDPSKYRMEGAGDDIVDPLVRLERSMKNHDLFDENNIGLMQKEIKREVEEASKAKRKWKMPFKRWKATRKRMSMICSIMSIRNCLKDSGNKRQAILHLWEGNRVKSLTQHATTEKSATMTMIQAINDALKIVLE